MNNNSIEQFIEVIKAIRDPKTGCPWDLKQTFDSLLKYLIEESYEYIQAVEEKKPTQMKEELGDILLQVMLHAQLASEKGMFDIYDIADTIKDKMIRRHPHVFQDQNIAKTEKEVIENWNQIKAKEKGSTQYFTPQDAYAPSLTASNLIGIKSSKVNFDWDNADQVWQKVEEELNEVKAEYAKGDLRKTEEEIGDLLFSIAQFARHLKIDPEKCLTNANKKFINRMGLVEEELDKENKKITETSRDHLEKTWNKIKT